MRILTLATLFPNAHQPNFGIFVERQTAAFSARAGCEVTVVNPAGIPPWPFNRLQRYAPLLELPKHGQWRGLDVHRPNFTLIPKIGGSRNPGAISRAILPLVRQLHEEKPFDLIDAEFFFPDGPAAMQLSKELGIPFTIKARGADIHHWGAQQKCRAQISEAANAASGLLAVSEALKGDMAAMGMPADAIMVHYTGIDRSRFFPRDRQAEKAKLGIDAPLIVSVGALIPRKQQDLIIRALPNLPDVHLMLVGHGESEGSYRDLAEKLGLQNRVHFAGSVAHDELPALLSAADIMALVSKSEGLANAWVEALACGTPVIASNVGGAPELVRSPDAGLIVQQTPQAITQAVEELTGRPRARETVAAQVSHMSWEENARQLEGFFRQIIESR